MTKKFKSLLTDKGKALIADAIAGGKTISLKYFAVGDGNGSEVTPSAAQTALVNEVARIELNSVKETDANKTTVAAEAIIPADKGGFWIREAGIFTADGVLVAVSQMPVTYKPDTDDGATSTQTMRILLAVSDASAISLTVDDSLIIATEAFVNEAIDTHAKSRNHPDASTTDKGFVQLSSETNSSDEKKAATPKAVKAANDNANTRVPDTRKINGHALSDDANVTAQDIFNGQVVDIGNAVDLNTITTPGLYRQAANAQAASGKNYPEANAGSLEVYKHAGITQVYRVYNNSRQYARTLYGGTWSAWGKGYDTNNKPTASDTAALPITGGNVTGAVSVGAAKKFSINPQNNATLDAHLNHWGNADRPTVLEFGDATSYHFYSQRNKDGSIIFTSAGTLNPANWSNFDARYYTQTAANGKFQPKGNYTPTGTAYTKAESDARYLLRGTAYTRLGAQVNKSVPNHSTVSAPAGCVQTAVSCGGSGSLTGMSYRPLQILVNGAWVNVASL